MSVKEEKRAKARKLIEQALDDGVGDDESSAFAVRAIKLIRKYKLLDATPLDGILEHPTVHAVKTVADKLADPEFTSGLGVLFNVAKSTVASAAAERGRRRRR